MLDDEIGATTKRADIRVWAGFSHYLPDYSGSVVQGHRTLKFMAAKGMKVYAISPTKSGGKSSHNRDTIIEGVIVVYLPALPIMNWNWLARIPRIFRLANNLNEMLRNLFYSMSIAWLLFTRGRRGDVFQMYGHICGEFSLVPTFIANKKKMLSVVRMTLLGSDDPMAASKHKRPAMRWLMSKGFDSFRKLVCISSALRESCIEAGIAESRLVRIANGVDSDLYHPVDGLQKRQLKQQLNLDPDKRYIVFVGAAQHRKGIDLVMRAFIKVADKHHDVELLIVGPSQFTERPRYTPEVQKYVDDLKGELKENNVLERVHWVGKVGDTERYLQVSDVFCLPSRREGLPNAVIEAMSVGLPVVVSRLEGITTDLIDDGNDGILIDCADHGEYFRALDRVLKDSDLAARLGAMARMRAVRDYDLDSIAGKYLNLYREYADGLQC